MFSAWLFVALVSQVGLGPTDGAGITVQAGGRLLHRTPVRYPQEALQARIGGTVVLDVTLDDEGVVSDARAVSGPTELRRAALESVLQWHYLRDESASGTVEATIEFRPPEPQMPSAGKLVFKPGGSESTIESIDVSRLPEPLQSMVRAKLASFLGQPLTTEVVAKLIEAARNVDRHLTVVPGTTGGKASSVNVLLPGVPPSPAVLPSVVPGNRTVLKGNYQVAKLIEWSPPEYPPLALQARIQGTVRFTAMVGRDGHVVSLQLISGHPLLVPAAQEAAKKYVYEPTLANGQPVEVTVPIDVNFTLP